MGGGDDHEARAGGFHGIGERLDIEVRHRLGVGFRVTIERHRLLGPVDHHAVAGVLEPGGVGAHGKGAAGEFAPHGGADEFHRVEFCVEIGFAIGRGDVQADAGITRRNIQQAVEFDALPAPGIGRQGGVDRVPGGGVETEDQRLIVGSADEHEHLVLGGLAGGDFPGGCLLGIVPVIDMELAVAVERSAFEAVSELGVHAHQHGEIIGFELEVGLELGGGGHAAEG